MRKFPIPLTIGLVLILLLTGVYSGSMQAEESAQDETGEGAQNILTIPTEAHGMQQNGAPQSDGSVYLANPLPPLPDGVAAAPFGADADAAQLPDIVGAECYDPIANPGFETVGGWFGQPSNNVGFNETAWNSGARSAFLNTNFYSNSALWQTVQIPAATESASLSFSAAVIFADPGETVYISVYNEDFSELLFWEFLNFSFVRTWKAFSDTLPIERFAGRTVQVTFQLAQDFDGLYSEIVVDDVSLTLCSDQAIAPPSTVTPTPSPTAPTAVDTPTATPSPTLLPRNTPTTTPTPPSTGPGATVDLSIIGIQIGQALMADADPVTGAPVPLIAQKPALARVYIDVSGADAVENLDGTLFVLDAQNQVHSVRSLNGPIQLVGDSNEGSPGSTLNFLPDVAWLQGTVSFRVELDPANVIAETNEGNNSRETMRTFQPARKLRIAWLEMNPGVNRQIAAAGDSDLRKLYPVGVNDVDYFFQPGFNQRLDFSLGVQTVPEYINALNRFWDRVTHEGSWVGGAPPDRLYGWTAGPAGGLCGVADAIWAGGRGRVATGYAQNCGAETLAHEIGHIFDASGLRHSPNRPREQDANCISQPVGAETRYPGYPGLPTGSIGVVGFDATQLEIIYPGRAYDFMTYCAPEWISPFNYSRMINGFGPVSVGAASETQEATTKLLVSGLVYTGTMRVELDPFYVIRSETLPEPNTGEDYCIELRDEGGGVLDSRCFDLGFVNIETGAATESDGFSLVAPYPQATAKVVLTHAGRDLASRTVSNSQPFVRLTQPAAGARLTGDDVAVAWTGSDLDGDPLFYSLDYSTDAGATWLPIAADLTSNSTRVDLRTLPGGDRVRFRVGASDGINTAYATSDSLEIGLLADSSIVVSGKPPVATIRTEVTHVDAGSAVILEGSGYDLEDGPLPQEKLRWWSNRDGELGTGAWLRQELSTGRHTLTLSVSDSDENIDVAVKTLQVGDSSADEGRTLYLPLLAR